MPISCKIENKHIGLQCWQNVMEFWLDIFKWNVAILAMNHTVSWKRPYFQEKNHQCVKNKTIPYWYSSMNTVLAYLTKLYELGDWIS